MRVVVDTFVECAVSAGASCIVSGDEDLVTLGEVEWAAILTPVAFLRHLAPR